MVWGCALGSFVAEESVWRLQCIPARDDVLYPIAGEPVLISTEAISVPRTSFHIKESDALRKTIFGSNKNQFYFRMYYTPNSSHSCSSRCVIRRQLVEEAEESKVKTQSGVGKNCHCYRYYGISLISFSHLIHFYVSYLGINQRATCSKQQYGQLIRMTLHILLST